MIAPPPHAPRVTVLGVEGFEQPFKLRLPFRFGVITVTESIQAYVRVHLRLDDGREGFGYAAEMLAAKWFDKNPALSDAQNQDQLRRAIELAAAAYKNLAACVEAGKFRQDLYYRLNVIELGLPPLVASFGNALVDRAVLDAVCRLHGVSFWTAMRSNLAGMIPHPVIADLGDFDFTAFLAGLAPSNSIEARHTVGLVDPITAGDQGIADRVNDGLPETLEEVVRRYGQRCFKLKVSGDLRADLDRLTRIASVLDGIAGPLHVTLDGNEQYDDVESVVELWEAMEAEPALQKLCAATLFIEQPIKRQAALSRSIAALARLRPVIIDESDGEIDSFLRARSLGYGGVSSKDCKGFYKSLVNLARCRTWNAEGAEGSFFLSGEDLTTQAGLAVQQDLALVSLLGLADVERNGHHFIDGFAGRPQGETLAFLQAHPDLYVEEDRHVRLRIVGGKLQLGSLECPGFGSAVVPDLSTTAPMAKSEWTGAAP